MNATTLERVYTHTCNLNNNKIEIIKLDSNIRLVPKLGTG